MKSFIFFLTYIVTIGHVFSDECTQIRTTLLEYAKTDCGSKLLQVMPPLFPGNDATPTPPTIEDTTPMATVPNVEGNTENVLIGSYYPNWFVYSKHYMGLERFGVRGEKIDPAKAESKYAIFPYTVESLMPKLTHLFYAFLDVDEDCFVVDRDPDASWYGTSSISDPSWIGISPSGCKGAMNDMLYLKDKYPHLKLLISLGGWTFSENFSACLKSKDNFEKIYKSFSFYVQNSDSNWGRPNCIWDGIDLDWEHPGTEANHKNYDADADWASYANFVTYLRHTMILENRTKGVITSAIGVGDTLDLLVAQPNVAKMFCDALDSINMMTYDLHGKWDPVTGHNAQFCVVHDTAEARPSSSKGWGCQERITLLGAICGYNKLSFGIPNYSPAWATIPETNNGLYQTATDLQNFVGWSTFSDSDSMLDPQGILHYWDIKQALLKDSSFKIYTNYCPENNGITVPVKHIYSAQRKAFACYEDIETVELKASWARIMGMKGIFFWDITQDPSGDLIDAARRGWGKLPEHAATGFGKCHDSGRPDFSKSADGSDSIYSGCHITQRTLTFNAGDGCAALRTRANQACNGVTAIAVGGKRSYGSTSCISLCGERWDAGPVGAEVGDTVYFVCKGESLTDGDSSGTGSSGNNSSGNNSSGNNSSGNIVSCAAPCTKCKKNPSSTQALDDATCQVSCIQDKVTWWPCDTTENCICAN